MDNSSGKTFQSSCITLSPFLKFDAVQAVLFLSCSQTRLARDDKFHRSIQFFQVHTSSAENKRKGQRQYSTRLFCAVQELRLHCPRQRLVRCIRASSKIPG